jgi:hypothetical protein
MDVLNRILDFESAIDLMNRLTFAEQDKLLSGLMICRNLIRERRLGCYQEIYSDVIRRYIEKHPVSDAKCVMHWVYDDTEGSIHLRFEYGDPQIVQEWDNDESRATIVPTFAVKIGDNQISLSAPDINIFSYPMVSLSSFSERQKKREQYNIVYNLEWPNMLPECNPTTKMPRKVLNDVYEGFDKKFINWFKVHAHSLQKIRREMWQDYYWMFSNRALCAVMSWLIIGRFRLKIQFGGNGRESIIPYDIVKLIAKQVWETRTDRDLWRNAVKGTSHQEFMFDDDNVYETQARARFVGENELHEFNVDWDLYLNQDI